jgi:hypothetical protein
VVRNGGEIYKGFECGRNGTYPNVDRSEYITSSLSEFGTNTEFPDEAVAP